MDWRRHDALGDLRNLSDDTICRILGRLDLEEVAKLACVSSVFYIFCNDEPLWMRLCLSSPSDKALVYRGTWKQTALARRAEELGIMPQELRPPLRFQGFSSLHLYRQWYRCHVDLRTFAFDTGHVDRQAGITPAQFAAKYDGKKPVLLTDLLGGWPASQSWTLPKLVERFGDKKFKVSQAHGKAVRMTLRDYAAYTCVQTDEEPLYIFDPTFGETAPPLLNDYSVPPLFGEDFLELLDEELRPPFRWLVAGPPRSGAGWHVDPSLTSAWNALLGGRKRWAFYPPGKVPPGVTLRMSDDGDMSFDGPPSLQWWLDVYPHVRPEDRPLECTQLPGETIFVPGGWWHCVLNIEESVAVTHNFMNEAGFETVLSDLAPGHVHRALFRAGRLAQTHLVDSPEQAASPADIAWAHFTSPGEDYISKQALRELLRKMWAIRPDLRKRLWQCACKTIGADHWQQVLGAVSRAHGLVPPGREESLPLSGGRNAIFRLGGKVVKVFVRLVDEDESEDDEEGPVVEVDKNVDLPKKRSFRSRAVTNTLVTKAFKDASETGDGRDGGAQSDVGRFVNGTAEDSERQNDHTEGADDETPGSDQEEMFRTELLMHELIRTSGSPLSVTVPALLDYGVLVEAEDGSLTLDETESAGVRPTETESPNGTENPGATSNGHANGHTTPGNNPPQNDSEDREGLRGGGRSVGRNPADPQAPEKTSGPVTGKRRWMYVVTAECEGTPLADVYDQLSKPELLELARFLSRQVGYIHALPLPPDAGQTSKPPCPVESPQSPDYAHPSKRQKVAGALEPTTVEKQFQPRNGAHNLSQFEERAGACSHLQLNGHTETIPLPGCNGHTDAHADPATDSRRGVNPQAGAQSHLGGHSHPGVHSHLGANPPTPPTGPGSSPGATSHPRAQSSNLQPGVELPSLESLGVPLRWRPFATFLRAQRKELPERVTDLGLPTSLATSAEEYLPRDPVELLDFRTDPVWLHTDLLPDNILVKRRLMTASDEEPENVGKETEVGPETENGPERGANMGTKSVAPTSSCVAGPGCTSQNRRQEHFNGKRVDEDAETGGGKRVEKEGGGKEQRTGRYEAAHILDFADARTGDPLYEIASLHIGTFRGRPELLTAFLRASGIPAKKAPGDCAPTGTKNAQGKFQHSRSFRAMCFAVLHEINLLNLLSRHRHTALSDSRTWEELTRALFGELDFH